MFIYEEHLNLDTKISEQVDEKNTHLLIFLKNIIFFPIILDFLIKTFKGSKEDLISKLIK